MNYKVLYRKYRPDDFSSLVGQKPIVDILKNSIKEEKIAHAYIFSGPRGTGKTSTARILAKSINCLENQAGMACEKCENCLSFNTSPDIIEIDAASNNGVDEIRELINNVKIMPTSLKYKVYIIDEVHMLSPSAFNALLLTLEEPPEHVVFILATTNLESVPITILSRCQKFDFKRINSKDIKERLEFVCKEENIKYTEEALEEIAVLSDGGLRDALSLLDQLSKNDQEITIDLVANEVGSVSNQKILELLDSIDRNDVDKVESILGEFRNSNVNYKVLIKKLIGSMTKRAIDCLKKGINIHLTYDQYKNMVIDLNDLINKINVNVDPYTMIEIILLNYVEVIDNDNKEKKGSSKEEKLPEVKELVKENVSKPIKMDVEFIDIRINNCFVKATKDNLNTIKNMWSNYLNQVNSPKIKGLISDTMPVAASDEYALIVTSIKHKEVELNEALEEIEEAFAKMNEKKYKLVFLNEDKWNEEKKKYIDNLKRNYQYEYIVEKSVSDVNKEKTNESLEDIANTIFGDTKIEIE